MDWVAFPFSRGSSQPRDWTQVSCNAGDPGSVPGLGRSPGEGIGYPLQYSWASLVAQLVKDLPTVRCGFDLHEEMWVWSLGWEDPLAKGMATHSRILAWRIPWTVTIIEINCTINEIRLNHPETIIPLGSVEKIVFHEPGPQCQKGWGPLYQDV